MGNSRAFIGCPFTITGDHGCTFTGHLLRDILHVGETHLIQATAYYLAVNAMVPDSTNSKHQPSSLNFIPPSLIEHCIPLSLAQNSPAENFRTCIFLTGGYITRALPEQSRFMLKPPPSTRISQCNLSRFSIHTQPHFSLFPIALQHIITILILGIALPSGTKARIEVA